jgi:very-short-patch-repair endonuclease
MKTPRDLLKSIFSYIEEQLKDIDPRGFHLGKLKGFKTTPAELRPLPGVDFDLKEAGDHIWIRVKRLENGSPPAPPENKAAQFIRINRESLSVLPVVDFERIEQEVAASGYADDVAKELRDKLTIAAKTALDEYLPIWRTWVASEIPRRKTIDFYSDLFSISKQLSLNDATSPIELVCGIGISAWKIGEGQKIDYLYPVLTHAVEIALESDTMSLEIRPRAVATRVELDALVAAEVSGASEIDKQAKQHLESTKDRPINPFDNSSYKEVLKLVARSLDSKGKYIDVEGQDELPTPSDDLQVTEQWIIFTRPKNNKTISDDVRRLREKIESGCDIPGGPISLVTWASDTVVTYEPINFRGVSSRGESRSEPTELFFPLPYNQEQVTIIQRLERADGVTVQGPPGTGKTHTIANIICHYLANGKRVLVTSRGEQALKVLQEKIPTQIRPLTVALLTSDRDGIRQFQGSIDAIQHQVSQLIPETLAAEITYLQNAIDRAHIELNRIDNRVDAIALEQLSEISVDGIPYRAKKMAELVVNGEAKYIWFDDELSLTDRGSPPFGEVEMSRLRSARRALGKRIRYVGAKLPTWQQLPSTDEMGRLHDVLSTISDVNEELKAGRLQALRSTNGSIIELAKRLAREIELLSDQLQVIESPTNNWAQALRVVFQSQLDSPEVCALLKLFDDAEPILVARATYLARPVRLPDDALTSSSYREAIGRASKSGKPLGVTTLFSRELKKQIAATQISGVAPVSLSDWAHIQRYLELQNEVISFTTRWNEIASILSLPTLIPTLNALRETESVLKMARLCHSIVVESEARIEALFSEVFVQKFDRTSVQSTTAVRQISSSLNKHILKSDLAHAEASVFELREKLSLLNGDVTEALEEFLVNQLGNRSITRQTIEGQYSDLVKELRIIGEHAQDIADITDMAAAIKERGAVKFAHRICTEPVLPTGEDDVLRSDWREAWTWARLKTHLLKIDARDELVQLSKDRRGYEEGLARMYQDIVSKNAWLSTKRNATPRVLQALAGYSVAIRRIGQGTGPNAVRYRRDAQVAMEEAAGAIPCWIMSHSKISESMPAEIGGFDLVVVDEASQSDLWALPAIVRGKKILVVGDDKQVSPDGGFIASGKIQSLITRFLSDQPFKEEMTPEKSLYDLASRVFASQQVMLREHFRCVPAIISYSNSKFYEDAIQPLRIPKASERLDPPLIDVYVEDGLRDTHDRNKAEAEAIAEEIAGIIASPVYADRTIGVVSLLGFDQAKLIDSLVRERCDPSELIKRNFECGDARTFQGSERDIVFISLVVDRSNCKALSGNTFEQRFNVATSRARDRMYLYRSVKLADLSEKDLRTSLLLHFEKPTSISNEANESLESLCESEFEREVFRFLVTKGYKATPQVKSGAFRIDLVVEGLDDKRLAIELDGDEFHGPDRWQHDMARQRVLERAGWTFWRCFASTWAMRKTEICRELCEHLTNMGIDPIGSLDSLPTVVEKRIWKYELGDKSTGLYGQLKS